MAGSQLLVTHMFPPKPGGSGRWFWELYRRLPREQVVIAAGNQLGSVEFDQTHDLHVVRMSIALPSWGFFGVRRATDYLHLIRRLASVCRRYKADVIHAGCCIPEGFAAWLLRKFTGRRYLLFVHGEEMRIAGGSRELVWMARQVLCGADRIIANSHNTARILREEWQVADDRIAVLHPGVDTSRFRPAARDLAVRESLGWGQRPVVLTVGRLQKRKGHDMLIRALPTIRAAVPDVLYSIVGDGQERRTLETLARELGLHDHVQFRGEPNDAELVRCYQQCDLFALPNREVCGDIEGFGMVLVEAQACGKPVIAGRSGGTAETMNVPETGRLVDCDRPEPLAEMLADLLIDREQLNHMGKAARAWAVERFDWEPLTHLASEIFETAGRRPDSRAAMPGSASPAACEFDRESLSHCG
ncbi:MAG: glycosyltransferase family 4 protein [Pirellulales bacterium]|nr:glycosyltransferase family 4 protein [Pirellulales bacterium]